MDFGHFSDVRAAIQLACFAALARILNLPLTDAWLFTTFESVLFSVRTNPNPHTMVPRVLSAWMFLEPLASTSMRPHGNREEIDTAWSQSTRSSSSTITAITK